LSDLDLIKNQVVTREGDDDDVNKEEKEQEEDKKGEAIGRSTSRR
jgi:hypothetical protein